MASQRILTQLFKLIFTFSLVLKGLYARYRPKLYLENEYKLEDVINSSLRQLTKNNTDSYQKSNFTSELKQDTSWKSIAKVEFSSPETNRNYRSKKNEDDSLVSQNYRELNESITESYDETTFESSEMVSSTSNFSTATTTSKVTTRDPVDVWCDTACRDGTAGDECNCPDHPVG